MKRERPTEGEFEKGFKCEKEAAGTDGYSGKDLRQMPKGIAKMFRRITERLETGEVPKVMKEARQKNWSKSGKVKADGRLEAGHTRPISIFQAWWRTYTGVWVKEKSAAEFRRNAVPIEVVRGKGSQGLEGTGSVLIDAFEEMGMLGTLDHSLCYEKYD